MFFIIMLFMRQFPLEVFISELLHQQYLLLAVAESCSGGLLAHRLTNVPGSSDYFLGGVIAYHNQIKTQLLGVQPVTLTQFGAVSRQTVIEMAQGVRQVFRADIGLSISGIAGPGGGTDGKPVGLTWIGLSASELDDAWSYIWPGNRLEVKEQATEQALQILADFLSSKRDCLKPKD